MRLYGRWHKGHRRCTSAAYRPKVVKVAGIPVAYGRCMLPPRGAALRHGRVGFALKALVHPSERYWREPGQRVTRYKPQLHRWGDWRLSQGFIGGAPWRPSQLRKPNRPKASDLR